MKLTKKEINEPMELAMRLLKELAGTGVSINTILTALSYTCAMIMHTAEMNNPRNNSEGVADMIRDTIQQTYDKLKSSDTNAN